MPHRNVVVRVSACHISCGAVTTFGMTSDSHLQEGSYKGTRFFVTDGWCLERVRLLLSTQYCVAGVSTGKRSDRQKFLVR